jgi:ribonucleoside-diphosphate reductase alpha chain
MWKRLGYAPLRNATVTTVAPTGTISILAGCSSGIEPIFAAALTRNVLDGEKLVDVHPPLVELLGSRGYPIEKRGISDTALREVLGAAWSPAHDVSVSGHLRVQAAFQRHSDSGVSKTINLPQSATEDDIRWAYLEAFERGCKGITVFRDGSRGSQVLERASESTPSVPPRTFVCETC